MTLCPPAQQICSRMSCESQAIAGSKVAQRSTLLARFDLPSWTLCATRHRCAAVRPLSFGPEQRRPVRSRTAVDYFTTPLLCREVTIE
jgi:hypothetical protein